MLAIVAAVGMSPTLARAAAPDAAHTASTEAPQATIGSSAGPERFDESRYAWSHCTQTPSGQCTRPRPARVALLAIGALAGGAAAGLLFALGDRLVPSDPAVILAGTGGLAAAGAVLGMAAGHVGGDGPGAPDRVYPATSALTYGMAPPTYLDERSTHTMALRFAPSWAFADNAGRVRLVGHLGGLLAATQDVDPRPQFASDISGQEGSAPVVLQTRQTSIGVGLDWAVRLPYPVLSPSRSTYLGPAEIRWKPDVQIRRDIVDVGQSSERIVSRTMLLPLTVGMRWHLSPRQRFTVYAGPRLDIISLSEPGSDNLSRGRAQTGPLYAEAWYDLDVPFTLRPRRDGRSRQTQTNGQLTLGYTHSRFDGQGFNLGPVVGFFGPFHAQWHTRVRPKGSPVAFQATAGVAAGNGVTMTASVGVVAPNLSRAGMRRNKRGAQ